MKSNNELPANNSASEAVNNNADISENDLVGDAEMLAEIEAIQAAIESGDEPIEDIETAAGEASDGGSSSLTSLERDGAETLAFTNFETAGSDSISFVSAISTVTVTATSDINNPPVVVDEGLITEVFYHSEIADYDNTLIAYQVIDGVAEAPQVIIASSHQQTQSSTVPIITFEGDNVQFILVTDGANLWGSFENDTLGFDSEYKLTVNGVTITEGIYYQDESLNSDGADHFLESVDGEKTIIAMEDLLIPEGDKDFNDLVISTNLLSTNQIDEMQDIMLDVTSNDNDPDGDSLTITEIQGTSVIDGGDDVEISYDGIVVGNARLLGGEIEFIAADYLSPRTTDLIQFDYTVSDGEFSATGTVSVTIDSVDDPDTTPTPDDDILIANDEANRFVWIEGDSGSDIILNFSLENDSLDLSDLFQISDGVNLEALLDFDIVSNYGEGGLSGTRIISYTGTGTQEIFLEGNNLGWDDKVIINDLLESGALFIGEGVSIDENFIIDVPDEVLV